MKSLTRFSFICTAVVTLTACSGTSIETKSETNQKSSNQEVTGFIPWPPADESVTVESHDPFARNVMLTIDTSGSMGDPCDGVQKLGAAKEAAIAFLDTVPNDAAIGLVTFGGSAETVVPLGFDQHLLVKEAIEKLLSGGGTPMSTAIALAHNELKHSGYAQYGYGDYHMVILGDGAPEDTGRTIGNLDWLVANSPININTIGFCANLDVLERVGVKYTPASNVAELKNAFDSVLAEASVFSDSGF